MQGNLPTPSRPDNRRSGPLWVCTCAALGLLALVASVPASALGPGEGLVIRRVSHGPTPSGPRREVTRRLAWEIRKRTSIETELTLEDIRLDDPAVFDSPLLYWNGETSFDALTPDERKGLRRFAQYGGFVVIDNASPDSGGFDQSVRRMLTATFPRQPLRRLDSSHTIFRSFYLLDRPVGRVRGPEYLEAIVLGGRAAVVYARHDLGGAWARDDMGNAEYPVTPGGATQREDAIRLGVNLVMYALCLDYKDDQVHAPFILRRRGGGF